MMRTTAARSLLPQPMNVAEILREHQDGADRIIADHDRHLDVHLSIDAGGAAQVDHSQSFLPQFPAARPNESLPFYRHRVQLPMRVWVRFAFSDLAAFPAEESLAQTMAIGMAAQELRRPLAYLELRQLAAAVRDILTSRALDAAVRREDRLRQEEWLEDQRGGAEGYEP